MNDGKELSIVEYLKRIDPNSSFMKEFETQRHIRRGFYEEYKIHCFNYVLLLFESVMRVLTTAHRDDDSEADDKAGKTGMHLFSKNYKKFLEQRQKKIDRFIVNCVGWTHIHRCVEVLEMTMRDLVYKIVPTKVVIRELKTSSGKVLTKDSEYTLVEKKRYVTVGKKTQVDYIFELDLREDLSKAKEEAEGRAKAEEERKANIFYLNLEDFSVYKLRCAVFLIQFPLMLTESILALWTKIIPQPSRKESVEDYSKQDIEIIQQVRHSIREFTISLVTNLKHLVDYLTQVKKEQPLLEQYQQINQRNEFMTFKEIFIRNRWVNFTPTRVDEFFSQSFEKMNESFGANLDNVIKTLEERINSIKTTYKV